MSERIEFDYNCFYDLQLANGRLLRLSTPQELNKYLINPHNPIPETNGGKTWVSNYVLTFWMPIMGVGPFTTYLQLTKYCYGEKEVAYPAVPTLARIMAVSDRTVQKYMRTLQDLGFVNVIQVWDSVANTNKTNLYLLSRTIPFLTDKQLEKLPKQLQDEHAKFVEKTKYRNVFE